MRTPAAMTAGLVLGPCGLVLSLTAALAPHWRELSGLEAEPPDVRYQQGLWDLCREVQSTRVRSCGLPDTLGYFARAPVRAARGLVASALGAAALGLALAALGVRCWRDEPRPAVAGLAGLVLLAAGLLGLVAASWYGHSLEALPAPAGSSARAGYSLVLAFLGSCLGVLAGCALALSFRRGCCCPRRRAPPALPSYTNPLDVLEGERPARALPCDSDL
ncbi:claudin-23 [Alligator mississippiensis]|uniref:claudin-23 n=1 Tax=Alligator mississippiensis TaxID=8496 RepID=UPI0028775D00|nr:claudin-23 [Alligator mississippiensis]